MPRLLLSRTSGPTTAPPLMLLLRPSLHGYVTVTAIHLLLHVGSEFDVLVEAADVAGDFVPGFEGEGYEGDYGMRSSCQLDVWSGIYLRRT